MIQFSAHFDGKNLCPDEPIVLPENVSLRVTVLESSAAEAVLTTPLDVFDRLAAENDLIAGPADWAAEHDHYLYGVAKDGNHAGE